uniref:Uncharacterized protein n=1 Tax=Cocksfoot mottle virus TaxID=40979 RepID=C0L974_9VIRU|nr:hypothetical protein [Cocksfoot mottle virus]
MCEPPPGFITIQCYTSDDLSTGDSTIVKSIPVRSCFFRQGVEVVLFRCESNKHRWSKIRGPVSLTVHCDICEFRETVEIPSLPKGFKVASDFSYSVTWNCCYSRGRTE